MNDLFRDLEALRANLMLNATNDDPMMARGYRDVGLDPASVAHGFRRSAEKLDTLLLKHAKAAASANPEARHDAINLALDRIAYLTDSGAFHGYRSEVWRAVAAVYDAAATAVHGTPCPGTLRPYERRNGGTA